MPPAGQPPPPQACQAAAFPCLPPATCYLRYKSRTSLRPSAFFATGHCFREPLPDRVSRVAPPRAHPLPIPAIPGLPGRPFWALPPTPRRSSAAAFRASPSGSAGSEAARGTKVVVRAARVSPPSRPQRPHRGLSSIPTLDMAYLMITVFSSTIQHSSKDVGVPPEYRIRRAVNTSKEKVSPGDSDIDTESSTNLQNSSVIRGYPTKCSVQLDM
uniref:Uncharacterized protein n=1 Tax=Oryza rufipogon TaxID=4529 RepID=A0A0E0RGW4_ORYRU